MSAASPEFTYSDPLPTGPDQTSYRLLTTDGVRRVDSPAGRLLQVDPSVLQLLTAKAMHDVAHHLRPAHLAQLRQTIDDPEASGPHRPVPTDGSDPGRASRHPVKTRLSLTGPLVVARDIAHAKIKERLDAGEPMPSYLRDHAVYYGGPAKTPAGYASGSFGPTTAGRMDSYVEESQAAGGSLVMLAKGNRSSAVTRACQEQGGFYLGSIGGPAARLARDCIRHVEVLEYEELGMEAVWKIDVEDFPAFIVVDNKGNGFFADTAKPLGLTIRTRSAAST